MQKSILPQATLTLISPHSRGDVSIRGSRSMAECCASKLPSFIGSREQDANSTAPVARPAFAIIFCRIRPSQARPWLNHLVNAPTRA